MNDDAPSRDISVFLNVPYEEGNIRHERFILAMMTALVACGRVPKATIELGNSPRIDRIVEAMRACRVSLHDLAPPPGIQRLNMPFEAGIAYLLYASEPQFHDLVVFERKGRDVMRMLSDLNGIIDAIPHAGTQIGVIQAVLDAFGQTDGSAPLQRDVERMVRRVIRAVEQAKRMARRETIWSRAMFTEAVLIIRQIVKNDLSALS